MNLSIYPWDRIPEHGAEPDPELRVLAIEYQPDHNGTVVAEFVAGVEVVERPDPGDPSATVEHVDFANGTVPLGWVAFRPAAGGDIQALPRAEFIALYRPHHHH